MSFEATGQEENIAAQDKNKPNFIAMRNRIAKGYVFLLDFQDPTLASVSLKSIATQFY